MSTPRHELQSLWWGSFAVLLSVLLAIAGVETVGAHGGDASVIHACIHQGSQLVRIVGPNDSCRGPETAVHWSIAGPGGFRGVQEFTTPGANSFTVPDGVTTLLVELWGGGGGGGGYARAVVGVVAGTTYTVHVGEGGAAGAAGQVTGQPGLPGDSSSFSGGVFAAGGQGGGGGGSGAFGLGGAGGEGDPNAPIRRSGTAGSHGECCVPLLFAAGGGLGGTAVPGTMPPPGSKGGRGGAVPPSGSVVPDAEPGSAGYVLIHW